MPGLWNFVLKVPITTHRFSNLRWQEADGSGGRQRELHQRIPPALIIIFIITITITVVLFRCVQCVKTCHFAAKKKTKKLGEHEGIIPTSSWIYLTHPPGEEPAGSSWERRLEADWTTLQSIAASPTKRQKSEAQLSHVGSASAQQRFRPALKGLLAGITSCFLCPQSKADFFKTFPVQSLLLLVSLLF